LAEFSTRAKWFHSSNQTKTLPAKVIGALSRWFKDEFKPCRQRETHAFKWGLENLASILFNGLVGVTTMLHIVYGTVVLSSALLVGPLDAVELIARLAASALVARGVLLFELYGLRETVEFIPMGPAHGTSIEDKAAPLRQ
jgi:hypothetical protein